MQIAWDNKLLTGHPVIDEQHKELFRRIGMLIDICQQPARQQELAGALHSVESHTILHFETEGKLMRDANFPDSQAHEQEHQEFYGHFLRIKKMFQTAGSDYSTVTDTIKSIAQWTGEHINSKDRVFCQFLREQAEFQENRADQKD